MRVPGLTEKTEAPSQAVAPLIVVILVYLVIAQSVSLFPRLITVDFYQYWGVSAALRLNRENLGTPYKDYRQYAATLAEYGALPGDPKLASVSRISTSPGFTATPFMYMLFGALPLDFTLALAVYHILQVVLFLAAVIALGAVYRYPLFLAVCLALLLVIASGSLSSDMRVGNVGTLQFASLAFLLVVAHGLRESPRPLALGAILLSGLTLLSLAKPNIALVAAAMALHLWVTRGIRFVAVAAVPAVVAGATAVIAASVYFRSWTAWYEWYRFVFGANPYALSKAPGPGNYSTSKILSSWFHADVWKIAAVVTGLLAMSLVVTLVAAARAQSPGLASRVRTALARTLGDPHVAMAIGVTMTIALPPLFWYHYYVIAVLPGMWLLAASAASPYVPLLGLAVLVLSQGLLNVLFIPFGWTEAVAAGAALTWVPLWGGILLCVYGPAPARRLAEPVAPPPVKGVEPGIKAARPVRRPRGPKTAPRA